MTADAPAFPDQLAFWAGRLGADVAEPAEPVPHLPALAGRYRRAAGRVTG